MASQRNSLLLAFSVLTSGCAHVGLHHATPSMPPPPAHPPVAVLRIEPNVEWTETPVTVRKGERLIIQATGEIHSTVPDRRIDPDGKGWSPFGVGTGGLLGRVDGASAFDIGARTHLFPDMHPRPPHIPFVPKPLRMKRDGKLFLGFKDWKSGRFHGAFTVTIWRPEP